MKRMLILIAAATTSCIVNAASAVWSVDNSYKSGTSEAAEGWSMYFFDNAEVSRADMLAAIAANSYDDYITNYGGAASDLTDSDGYADGYSHKSTYGNPETITGYFVLFDSDIGTTNPTFAYVSETMEATTGNTLGQAANFSFGDVTATQTASNWAKVGGSSVPEPTSGLLLLLGVAGLALKRRRA